MRVCLMVEGQEGVTWDDWLALAGACERHGFEALFRSDHYLSVQGRPERDALEAWATIAALAARTERLRLGTLVSPATFRHPSVLVGGEGGRRSLALAARWADEYNTIRASAEDCRARYERLQAAFAAAGRDPASARLSLMTTCIVGADRAELAERARQAAERVGETDLDSYVAKVDRQGVIGTVDEAVDRLAELEAAGVGRVMLRHLVHDDLDMVALLGREVLPNVAR